MDYKARPFIFKDFWGFLGTEYGIETDADGPSIYAKSNILGGSSKEPSLPFNRLSRVGYKGFFIGDVTFQALTGTTNIKWENVWYPQGHAENIERIRRGENIEKTKWSANLVSIFGVAALGLLLSFKACGPSSRQKPVFGGQSSQTSTLKKNRAENYAPAPILPTITYFDSTKYYGEVLNDLPHGQGRLEKENNWKYEGDFVNGQITGKGVFELTYYYYGSHRLAQYTGDFINGHFTGRGNMKLFNGTHYEGEWRNSLPNGIGTLTTRHPTLKGDKNKIYSGLWVNGIFQGFTPDSDPLATFHATISPAMMMNPLAGFHKVDPNNTNSDIFNGTLVNGRPEGQGVMHFNNGDICYGNFSFGQMNGNVVYQWPNRSIYHGKFENGEPHGPGVLTTAEGTVYHTHFDCGEMRYGTILYADGARYDGYLARQGPDGGYGVFRSHNYHPETAGPVYSGRWKNGLPHGEGTLSVNSQKYKGWGSWRNGCFIGTNVPVNLINGFPEICGNISHEGGDYSGPLQNGLPHGKGFLRWPSGDTYEGDFNQGQRTGKGEHVHGYLSKSDVRFIYKGDFLNGERSGKGTLLWFLFGQYSYYYNREHKYEGEWKNNKPHGSGTYTAGKEIYSGQWVYGCFNNSGYTATIDTNPATCGF